MICFWESKVLIRKMHLKLASAKWRALCGPQYVNTRRTFHYLCSNRPSTSMMIYYPGILAMRKCCVNVVTRIVRGNTQCKYSHSVIEKYIVRKTKHKKWIDSSLICMIASTKIWVMITHLLLWYELLYSGRLMTQNDSNVWDEIIYPFPNFNGSSQTW